MKKSILLISLILSLITAQPGSFSVPNAISFQGMLTNIDGSVYQDGDYELTFRFIRTMQDGSEQAIWEEVHTASVSSGVFSVILGSNTPLPQNVPGNAMLETQVGDEILAPRQPLTSVPFALRSNSAQFSNQSLMADTAQFAHNANYSVVSDSSSYAVNSLNTITMSGLTADELQKKILNEYILFETQTVPANIYTEIANISFNVEQNLDIQCFARFTDNTSDFSAGQIVLKNSVGEVIDYGATSWTAPPAVSSVLMTVQHFLVTPGNYTVCFWGLLQNEGNLNNVYLLITGIPGTNGDRGNASNGELLTLPNANPRMPISENNR